MDRLLQLLSTNSGFTTAEIATMLGEPEDYIKAQIKEYETQGIIKGYQAVVNWENTKENYLLSLRLLLKRMQALTKWRKCVWHLTRWILCILWRVHMILR
mgnify:CR=1 FL=1